MPFSRYVEVGRVALISYGPEYGKLVVITDVVDQNRALIDRPDEERRVISFNRLRLTDLKIDVPRLAAKKVLSQAFTDGEVEEKFGKSAWGKKLESRRKKAALTDFERYKAAVTKTKKSKAARTSFNKLKKQQQKA